MKYLLPISILIFFSACFTAAAQGPIPTGTPTKLQFMSRDTALLAAYNIYGFSYVQGKDTLYAEFIVPKPNDTFSRKSYILAKLQPVEEFMVVAPDATGRKLSMPVTENITVGKPNDGTKTFLNFDPLMPEPVFLLKEVVAENTK